MNIAIIPARGGSKRIPKKNIKNFCGYPILKIVIENAKSTNCFDKIIVSTDDEEIKKISLNAGAEVPFIRDKKLSTDLTPTVDVISDTILKLKHKGEKIENVCCLYPTSVFTDRDLILKGLNLLIEKKPSYVISVCSFSHPIQRALRLQKSGKIKLINKELANTRTQDLEEFYFDAGQFYWGEYKTWLEKKSLLSSEILPVILKPQSFQDIDTPEQWIIAENIYKSIKVRTQKDVRN